MPPHDRRASFVAACGPAFLALSVLVGHAAYRLVVDAGRSPSPRWPGMLVVAALVAFAGTARVFVRYRERDRWLALALNLGSCIAAAAALAGPPALSD